jgi:hypothetical protein
MEFGTLALHYDGDPGRAPARDNFSSGGDEFHLTCRSPCHLGVAKSSWNEPDALPFALNTR